MPKSKAIATSLVDMKDCCLILIDVQQGFLDKLPKKENKRLAKRLLWLLKVAVRLGIPLVVTAEDIKRNGSVIPKLSRALPVETEVHNKMVFDLTADPKIMSAVQATGRKTAVLTGMETDVCVAHSALGLLEQGYRVVVVEDVCASPGKAHANGLARIRDAGALLSNVKSLYYEWLRTVEASRRFHRKFRRELGDPGITL
jgi:nicotinamidase-related amidase